MRILFVNEGPFLPQVLGGIEISTLQLSHELQAAGHSTAVMSRLGRVANPLNLLWLRNKLLQTFTSELFPCDEYEGVRVYRGCHFADGIPAVTGKYKPDVVVFQGFTSNVSHFAAKAVELGYPTFIYVHDVGAILRNHLIADLHGGVRWIANSRFSQQTLLSRLNCGSQFVPPLMHLEAYRTASTREFVTMINPCQLKGGPIALDIAASCPDIPFMFVEGWQGKHAEVQSMKERAGSMRNVTWLASQNDMSKVYGRTRLLLVPSRCPETWCRVVTEAHISAVPTAVSDASALPETVGPGGIVVPLDAPVSTWVDAVRRMWVDGDYYQAMANAAGTHSERSEILPQKVAQKFVEAISQR